MCFPLIRHIRQDGVVTLAVTGEVDLRTAGPLRAAIQEALRTPQPVDVVVDLAAVTFLDCAGMGALVAGRNTAIRQRRRYTVTNPRGHVHRVLEITGLLPALTHGRNPAQRPPAPPAPRPPACPVGCSANRQVAGSSGLNDVAEVRQG